MDAFASTVVVPKRGSYNQSDFFNGNETDREQIFSGLYFSTTALEPQVTDLYVLHLHENDSARYQPNPLGDSNFFTLGLRVKSKPGAFAAQAESGLSKDGKTMVDRTAGQKQWVWTTKRRLLSKRVKCAGWTSRPSRCMVALGYTFDTAWKPRAGVEYNFGSGDSDPLDGDIETFQNLFPTNHKFYGQMDVFSWQNMHDLAAVVKIQPMKAVTVKAECHAFWLASTRRCLVSRQRGNSGAATDAGARNADNYAGSEIDLTAQWTVNSHFTVEAGYSHFFAGGYLSDTGASDDADFGYVQATVSF